MTAVLRPMLKTASYACTRIAYPGGAHMDMIGEFAARLYLELRPITEWALRNWLPTLAILVGLIYWAGRQRRAQR